MGENKKKQSIIIASLVCLIIALMLYIFYINKHNQKIEHKEQVIVIDTVYNKVVLDSIEYNIIKRDSVVYNLKQEMQYETNKVFNMSDSATIKLFYQLVSE